VEVNYAELVHEELTSSNWLQTLAQVPDAIERGASGSIRLDLTRITWIGQLPLLAMCLGVQVIAQARFDERQLVLPVSRQVRAFLDRWHFLQFARHYGFAMIDPVEGEFVYSEATTGSRVLDIRMFHGEDHAKELRDAFRRSDTDLRQLLTTAAFLDERDIHGLADLIVYELCENAVQHADTQMPAIIFGRISPRNDSIRRKYTQTSGEWERMFFERIRTEGMTELVIGDGGSGIISSLQKTAEEEGITEPDAILRWAFEPLSTRKRDRSDHTRGLWAVKNKVRELRGILYVRTGISRDLPTGGWSASWDFFNNPSTDTPVLVSDNVPFSGTQIHILLPHRTEASPYTLIEYHRPILARQKYELATVEVAIPPEPRLEMLDLARTIQSLGDSEVLFVDMSQMTEKWRRGEVDVIGRQIFDGLRRRNGRVWLLNPPPALISDLSASSWLVDLWREQAILVPFVAMADPLRPPRISYVVADEKLRSGDAGDTVHSRRTLIRLIGAIAGASETHDVRELSEVNHDELHWLRGALAKNPSLVEIVGDGEVGPALDVEKLGRRAVLSLLQHSLKVKIQQKMIEQASRPPMLYRLPSQTYCREYIDPRIFAELSPATRSALETWIEERVAATKASYAISYTTFASELLTRAERTGSIRALEPLRHYSRQAVRRTLSDVPSESKVVLLAAISGSGKTIVDAVRILAERNISTSVICVIDTTTPAEHRAIVNAIGGRGEFYSRSSWPIEKWDKVPPQHADLPIAIIDPETLLPVMQISDQPTRLHDGEFWRYVAEQHAVTVGAIRYKGVDYTSQFWMRHLLRHAKVVEKIIEDFQTCFEQSPGTVRAPDIICYVEDTVPVISREMRAAIREKFPNARLVKEARQREEGRAKPDEEAEQPIDSVDEEEIEGSHVVIFSAASNSGAGLARLKQYFLTAKRIHLSIFLNRIPDGLMLALTGPGTRVSLTTFQRLMSASPELRLGSARSIMVPALMDYRASAVSNRLLLFIEEERRKRTAEVIVAQSADELNQVAIPDAAPEVTFEAQASYSFATAAGREALQRLVRGCRAPDAKWLYAILDEVASRAEASPHTGNSTAWQHAYIEQVRQLYVSALTDDPTARQKILEALLLDRWRWQERRDRQNDPDSFPATKSTEDDISLAFARELLEELQHANEALRVVIIRSISKIARPLLIQSLEIIIDVARRRRDTELTLGLELTKILDDHKTSDELRMGFTQLVRRRAQERPLGRDDQFDVALEDLLADIGLMVVRGERQPMVRFLAWPAIRDILENEPPDHDRTIRALIRAMRGRFGPGARFLYYKEVTAGRYAYGDGWPRRAVADTRPISFASLRAVDLLADRDYFISERLGSDPRPEAQEYLKRLRPEDEERFRDWGIALFRMRRGNTNMGLMRVWQDVNQYGKLSSFAISEMIEAIGEAVKLIDRGQSAVPIIGEWQYEQMMAKLHEQKPTGTWTNALERFAERVRLLLGGDVTSVLVRDGNDWTRMHLGGRAQYVPLRFRHDERGRLTSWVAEHREGRIFHDRKDAAQHGFVQRPAVEWAEAWFAIPLLDNEGNCSAVLHVWHHVPGWFESARPLMKALTVLGGTVIDLSETYRRANEVRQILAYDSMAVDRASARLINLTLASEGLASGVHERLKDSDTQLLVNTVRKTQEELASLLNLVPMRSAVPVPASLEAIVQKVVKEAVQTFGPSFSLTIHGRIPPLNLRVDMIHRAVEELLRNAKAHLRPEEKVSVNVMRENDKVVVAVRNPGYGIPAEQKNAIFTKGSGLLLVKAAAERHEGKLEEVGEPGKSAEFRMIFPLRNA